MAKSDLAKVGSGNVINLAANIEQESLDVTPTNSFIQSRYTKIEKVNVDTVTEDYVYKFNGTTVGTVRVIYTDNTKDDIVSIEKTS